jgi:hypothetical protein
VVHELPSLQLLVFAAYTQPVAAEQLSSVQGLPSLHWSAAFPETQIEAPQTSPTVQASPSLQDAVLATWPHPDAGSQLSEVHGLASSQSGAPPAVQTPKRQASPVVQALPSSQTAEFAVKTQPVAASQLSSVHGFPSSQTRLPVPTQLPALQISVMVQLLPSLHASVL